MFVRNSTAHAVVLRKGLLHGDRAVATVSFQLALDLRNHAAPVVLHDRAPKPTDPPDPGSEPLWYGVSVTACGTAWGPSKPPYCTEVALSVGGELRHIRVFGPRRWIPGAHGRLVPSPPGPFASVALTYEHAFGGSCEVPAATISASGLPHGGGRVVEGANPGGIGLYPSEAAALGRALPSIEWTDSLIRTVADRPLPAGFAPCAELPGLRFTSAELGALASMRGGPSLAAAVALLPETWARSRHHAHGRLIFETIPSGTRIGISGLGARPLAFHVPDPQLGAALIFGPISAPRSVQPVRLALRSIHVAADDGIALLAFGGSRTYPRSSPPQWVVVSPIGGGSFGAQPPARVS